MTLALGNPHANPELPRDRLTLTFRGERDYRGGMAHALRLERPGARNHVTARGHERRPIYREDRDRTHFEELKRQPNGRFGGGHGLRGGRPSCGARWQKITAGPGTAAPMVGT